MKGAFFYFWSKQFSLKIHSLPREKLAIGDVNHNSSYERMDTGSKSIKGRRGICGNVSDITCGLSIFYLLSTLVAAPASSDKETKVSMSKQYLGRIHTRPVMNPHS